MSNTLIQPFNIDTTKSYTLGNLTVTGNLAVGNTATGSQAVEISRPSTVYAEVRANTPNAISRLGAVDGGAGPTYGIVGTFSNHPLYLASNNVTRMILASTGDIQLNGANQRILGDFTNSSANARPAFRTNTVGQTATYVGATPSGISGISAFRAHNARDAGNAAFTALETTTTTSQIVASVTGTGSQLPLAFVVGNTEAARFNTAGNLILNGNTANARLDVNGSIATNIVAVPALDIDCSQGTYFVKTIDANSTFTFSNPPASRAYSFTLEVTHTSGSINWPGTVTWPSNTAPVLTTGRTHLFMFVTDDAGTRWRGAALVDYTN